MAPPTADPREGSALSFRFKSFRARILTFVLGLLLVLQGVTLLAVNEANVRNAREHVDATLAITAEAFQGTLRAREGILLEKAELLSGDFAFKEAVATGDQATLLSALENHRARVGAAVMMLVAMDGPPLVRADTLLPDVAGRLVSFPHLVSAAERSDYGVASSIEFLGGRSYQLVVTPLFMPDPMAWIVIGFTIDDSMAAELQESTGTHVSLLRHGEEGGWLPFASTLPEAERESLAGRISYDLEEADRSVAIDLAGTTFLTWVAPVGAVGETSVATVLQRSLDEALEPYLRLRAFLLVFFGAGVAVSVLGGFLLAGRVTRPVAVLVEGAERIEGGDYTQPVLVEQEDELGLLADSFNRMTRGLAERDRVRNLLGKVVSPAVAEELLSKEIELGGEERVVSVLFSDVRNFTSISERMRPQELLAMLNTYLTRVSAIVEEHEGVVDKYIGDAVMALFGAPLGHPDDALRAVRTAMGMVACLDEVNAELGLEGDLRLGMGVGVSTGTVVAGNMGSISRLNYTVIGDSVNVASRLEGLTKRYGVGVVVGASTRNACPDLRFRELDRVRVKGRKEPLAIFEPLGEEGAIEVAVAEEAARWEEALARFRSRDWDAADTLLAELAAEHPDCLVYPLYRERVAHFRAEPPPPEWDGTTTYEEK